VIRGSLLVLSTRGCDTGLAVVVVPPEGVIRVVVIIVPPEGAIRCCYYSILGCDTGLPVVVVHLRV